MIAFIKKLLLLLGCLFLFAFMQFTVFFLGFKIFVEKNPKYGESGIGAFMGAFFAFMFLIVGKIYEKFRERRKKHLDVLVKLEHMLHELR